MHHHHLQSKMFDYAKYMVYFLYLAVAFGLFASAPEYLTKLNTFIKLYISLFLIWRFNPWTSTKFTNFDKKIVYEAGVYLLLSIVLNDVIFAYMHEISGVLNEIQTIV